MTEPAWSRIFLYEFMESRPSKRRIRAQARSLMQDEGCFFCLKCEELFDDEGTLKGHIKTERKHRYGVKKLTKKKNKFCAKIKLSFGMVATPNFPSLHSNYPTFSEDQKKEYVNLLYLTYSQIEVE